METCNRCIIDYRMPGFYLDESGVCNYCAINDSHKKHLGTGSEEAIEKFEILLDTIKKTQKKKKYDCIVGVSGGTDSSYLLMKCVDWGLRPLAVHYDNTWNSAIATQNIKLVTQKLKIDLYTYVVDNREIDDIKRAFIISGISEFEADTDLAYVQVTRSAAAKFGVKYIFEGHSFLEEGISPISGNYFDGAYIADVHRKYGNIEMKTFPNMRFFTFLKWALIYRQKFIRPFWYIPYEKSSAISELESRLGWQYYGGHHLENRASSFLHKIWWPKKYDQDFRCLPLAAKVRNGKMNRDDAIDQYAEPIEFDKELFEFVSKRTGLSEKEIDNSINSNIKRNYSEFKNYKKRFEALRPLFRILAKYEFVTESFYKKYCFKP